MSVIPGRPPYNTPNFGLPVPGGEEDADGVSAVAALADKLDDVLKLLEDQIPEGGGGGGGGDLVLIEDQITDARVDTIEFTAIPQTFKHLRLIVSGQTSTPPGATGDVYVQINGITSPWYSWTEMRSGRGDGQVDVDSARLGVLADSASGGPGGVIVCDLPDYSRQFVPSPTFIANSGAPGEFGHILSQCAGSLPESPVTAITLLMGPGDPFDPQFLENCRATLYGLR